MKYRAWTFDEIPVGAIVTFPPYKAEFMILGKKETAHGTWLITPPDNDGNPYHSAEKALELYMVKIGGKWQKCGVEI